jgi:hypothetical protein
MAKKTVSKEAKTKKLIELANSCVLDTGTPDSSAALVWGPKIGYMFRSPKYEDGDEVSSELVALAACFVRLADPVFIDEMVQWYARNQN